MASGDCPRICLQAAQKALCVEWRPLKDDTPAPGPSGPAVLVELSDPPQARSGEVEEAANRCRCTPPFDMDQMYR